VVPARDLSGATWPRLSQHDPVNRGDPWACLGDGDGAHASSEYGCECDLDSVLESGNENAADDASCDFGCLRFAALGARRGRRRWASLQSRSARVRAGSISRGSAARRRLCESAVHPWDITPAGEHMRSRTKEVLGRQESYLGTIFSSPKGLSDSGLSQ
jgi:hypothetical protein